MDLLEREVESTALDNALGSASQGEGLVALVSGEAGIGKTALVRAFADRCGGGGRFLWGLCDDLSTPRVLGPMLDVVSDVGPELADALTSVESPDVIFGLVLAELRRPPVPVVLVIEDVHWADQRTLDLIVYLARRIESLPALLVLTYRTDELDRAHPLIRSLARIPAHLTVRLPLAALSVAAIGEFVAGDADELHRITGGNPFYLAELMAAHDEMPGSVVDAVLARVDRLPDMSRSLLELIALSPSPVETSVLDACRPGWAIAAVEPEARGIVGIQHHTIGFRHEIARRAVAEQVPASRAAELHRLLLNAMMNQPVDPARIVHHAAAVGDGDLLLRFGLQAARDAARFSANREAAQHFARVEPFLPRLLELEQADVLEQWATVCLNVGELERSATLVERALAIRRRQHDVEGTGRLLRFLAQLQWPFGRLDEAERLGAEAVEVLSTLEPGRELAYTFAMRAGHAFTAWRSNDAERFGRRAAELAEQVGADDVLAMSLVFLGTMALGHGVDETATVERAIELSRKMGDHHMVCVAYANLAETATDQRQHERAARFIEQGIAYADDHEVQSVLDYLTALRSRVALSLGRWEDANDLAETVLEQAGQSPVNQFHALHTVARIWTRRGDQRAGDAVRRLEAVAERSGELQRLVPAATMRAELAELQGEPAAERIRLRELLDRIAGTGELWPIGEVALWLSRAGASRVERDRVLNDVPEVYRAEILGRHEEAAAGWEHLGCPYEQADALAHSGSPDLMLAALATFDDLGAAATAGHLRAALRGLGVSSIPRGPRSHTRQNPAGLTGRQVEVLAALSQGLTNAEIAEQLVVSVRTVDHHVSAILTKLGVGTRRQATGRARELGVTFPDD
ncbi:MAG TPA: AAA family ATPase [Jiangellaceae bacterium]|nr:AAA family ATPase [Jiangellaceae bacterium]